MNLSDDFFERWIHWFQKNARVLPWRDQPTPYRVWVSEIMLQQTQVATVIPFFERFIQSFPSVEVLAAASADEVRKHWAGLGYYRRAENLHRAAKRWVSEQGKEPQDTLEYWLSLPGVGPYTAGAVLSIAYQKPHSILDGNVERVASRVLAFGTSPKRSWDQWKKELWRISTEWVETAYSQGLNPSDFNQAMMELGATVL